MTFSRRKLPKSQIEFDIQLTPEEFGEHRPFAVAELAKRVKLEGFRPGHVPVSLAEKQLTDSAILQETARLAIGKTWRSILQEEEIDPIGEPEVEILKLAPGNAFEFRIRIAQLPEIAMPNYKTIASKSARKQVAVNEKEVDDALQWLRESRKTKDGGVPEATNEFAQGLGNFTDLASLKASIKEGLQHEKETKETERLRQEIIENVAKEARLEVPDILVKREKQVLLANLKQGVAQMLQIPFEEYLKNAGKTEEELLASLQEEAELRVRKFLVVREVAQQEQIQATREEIETEAQALVSHYQTAQKAKQQIDPKEVQEYTEGVLRHEKTLQFLENLAQT